MYRKDSKGLRRKIVNFCVASRGMVVFGMAGSVQVWPGSVMQGKDFYNTPLAGLGGA